MANVIESFFIALGLDTSEYEKKQKGVEASLKKMGEVSDKQTKLIAESGKKAASAFSLLKVEVLGALAAFGMGAGFKAFIQDSMNAQAQTGRMAETLGVSVRSMRAYQLMAQEMGGSGEAAVATLKKVASGLAAARSGDTSFLTAGSQYGVVLNVNDNAQTTLEKLNARAYAIKQRYGGAQASQFLSLYGITDLSQQSELTESPAKFAAAYAHAMSLSGGMTKQSIAQAEQLQVQWADFMRQMENLRNNIFAKLEPVLIRLGTEFQNWLNKVDWNKVIADIGSFIDKVQQVVKEMGGWKTVAEVLGAVLALKVLSPVLSIVGALARMVPLLGGAISGVAKLAAGFGSLGLAVAAAATAGGLIGHEIWKHLLEGNKAGDAVGSFVAQVMADLGFKDAQDAVDRMNGKGPVNHSGDYRPERTAWVKQRELQAMDYFTSQAGGGFTREQAAGIVGNLMQESMLNPNAVNPTSGALGIGQWLGSRATQFEQVEGVPLKGSDFQKQLDFIHWELTHTEKRSADELRQTSAIPNATLVFGSMYERYGDDGSIGKRIAYANSVLSQKGAYPGAQPSTTVAKAATTNNDVHIGTIAIHTKATDAYDIFKDARKAVNSHPLIQGSVTAAA